MVMTVKKKTKSNKRLAIETMTALYKKHYDDYWTSLAVTSQQMILEDPLGRRAKDFAHEVAKRAEAEAYSLEKIKGKLQPTIDKQSKEK